jgi:hypothetical protein
MISSSQIMQVRKKWRNSGVKICYKQILGEAGYFSHIMLSIAASK